MLKNKTKFVNIALIILLVITLLVPPFFNYGDILGTKQILSAVVAIIGALFLYFDEKIDQINKEVEERLRGFVDEISLSEAMRLVAERRTHWKKVRILATSTGQIQPLFRSNNFSADLVQIVLRDVTEIEISQNPDLEIFKQDIGSTVRYWNTLQEEKRIKDLEIVYLKSFPIEYNLIFEEKILISGLLEPSQKNISQVSSTDPIVVFDHTPFGKREILKYIRRFDCIFSCFQKQQI